MATRKKYPLILQRVSKCEVCHRQLDEGAEDTKLCRCCLNVSLSGRPGEHLEIRQTFGHYRAVRALQRLS